jgi:hypothetical protein
MPEHLASQYATLKRIAARNLGSTDTAELIASMAEYARTLLASAERVGLTSRVSNKLYFGYHATRDSRPLNLELFAADDAEFAALTTLFREGFTGSSADAITRATYSLALTIFAANDINNVGRKASATFFEVLIGHIVARLTGVNPRRKVRIPESGAELPTDYVFDMGTDQRKLHLPLKTSTRERAVQAWVHQLVLDRIFGNGIYKGVLVVSSETKRNAQTGEVIEICTPRQLQMFQSRVTEMSRVYYLDPPDAYLALSTSFPRVDVKPFGEMFAELPILLRG